MNYLFATLALIVALAAPTHAEEIKVLSTGLFRGVLPALAPEFERKSGHKIVVSISTPGVLRDRLLKGEMFDVVFVPTNFNVDDIVKSGIFALNSRKDVGRTYLGVAVRSGTPKPDLSTPTAVKAAVMAVKTVALTDPTGGAPIGRHIQDVAEKLGFGAELKARTKAIVGSGEDVALAVAKREADIGMTLNSEIAAVRGVDIAGNLPAAMQLRIIGYGVVTNATHYPDAGRALIDFMLSLDAKRIMQAGGIDPL